MVSYANIRFADLLSLDKYLDVEDTIFSVSLLQHFGINYHLNLFVVLHVIEESGLPVLGKIIGIFRQSTRVYFIVELWNATLFNLHWFSYDIEYTGLQEVIRFDDLKDYNPYTLKRNYCGQKFIVFRHKPWY